MKGSVSIAITLVAVGLLLGLYFFLFKGKLEERRDALRAETEQQKAQLAQIEIYKVEKEELKKLLPRWKEQFEIFRQAIPVKMEDDVFLRNLDQQLRANDVRLMAVEVAPAGQWFANINEVEEANYRNENVKPEELRLVKIANFSVSLMGDFGNVLRAFENLKLYGRIYSLDRIIGPAGGAGGAVFQNEDVSRTPILVSGRIFYGLSENYLSQDTLDKFFGRADAIGAAGAVYDAAIGRGDALFTDPSAIPAPSASSTAATGGSGGAANTDSIAGENEAETSVTETPASSAKAGQNARVAQHAGVSKSQRLAAGG